MKIKINKSVLLESDYIYHYSRTKFKTVKNRHMLGLPAPKEASDPEKYSRSFSAFFAPISKEQIEKIRKAGFIAWGKPGDPIYEYQISISDNKNSFVNPIKLTSTIEQREFINKTWDKYWKDNNINIEKIRKDDNYWKDNKSKYLKLRKEYSNKEDKYLKSKGVYTVTINDFESSSVIKKLRLTQSKNINYNIIHGNKRQYATYIPHIHSGITKPLIPEKITKIV